MEERRDGPDGIPPKQPTKCISMSASQEDDDGDDDFYFLRSAPSSFSRILKPSMGLAGKVFGSHGLRLGGGGG